LSLHDLPQGPCGCLCAYRARHAGSFSSDRGRGKTFRFRILSRPDAALCSACGTHIVADRADQPHLVLRVATLDDDPAVRPVVHIWTSHDVPWLAEGEDLPRFSEWPLAR
jgi:hypothetical protein